MSTYNSNHTGAQLDEALNKALNPDTTPSTGSSNLVTSGAVKDYVDGKTSSKLDTSLKGAASGLAELDSSGKVPTSQLPAYVDDVLEYDAKASFPTTGETGKIYVDISTNKTYRWSGSTYTEISPSLALGETSSTAYRGDRGKTAYDHSQLKDGTNPHATTFANIASKPTTISGYGITDAKISSGTITLGSNSITPLTSSSSLNAAKLTGTASVNTTGNAATADVADNLVFTTIPGSADLDTYKTAGRYGQFTIATAKTIVNNPLSAVETGIILDVIKPDSDSTFQILYGIKLGGIYKRRAQGDTWVDWIRMATYDEVALKSHTHSYLPLSGGTLTGLLTANKGITMTTPSSAINNVNINFGTAAQIGANSNGLLGLYSTEKIGIRPGSGEISANDGVTFTTTEVTPLKTDTVKLGTSSYQWSEVNAKSFTVDKKVDMKYNATTQCLDFIFK